MLRRSLKIAVSTLVLGAVSAPAASADSVYFVVGIDGRANVSAWFDDWSPAITRAELVRGGAVVDSSNNGDYLPGASLRSTDLRPGDVLNVYRANALAGSVTYSGLPAIDADACTGRSAFTVTRDEGATIEEAGSYVPGAGGYGNWSRSIWTRTNPATVTIDRPLVLGGVAWVETYRQTTWGAGKRLYVSSQREVSVQACPVSTSQPPFDGPAPKPAPTPTPSPAPPTLEGLVKSGFSATRAQLGKLDPAKAGRKSTLSLSFNFPAQGSVKLQLSAKAKGKTVVLGTGSKTAPRGPAKVTVKLTKAGRSLLKGSKKLKVTVDGTFTPATSGAKPISQRATVTLARAAKQSK